MAYFRFFCLQSKVYKSVVDDVITNVKEFFRDEGVDDQVLDELKAVRTDSKKRTTIATSPGKITSSNNIN